MPEWTVTEALASIKRKAQQPDANGALSDADYLDLINTAFDTVVFPLILTLREELFVAYEDYAITADQARYKMPKRASMRTVRHVDYLNPDDRGSPLPMTPLGLVELLKDYRSPAWDAPYGFTLEHNDVILVPTPAQTRGTMRVRYYRRPSRLVEKSRAGVITDITGATITLASAVSAFNADMGPVSAVVDVVDPNPPFRGVYSTTVTIDGTSVTWPTNPADDDLAVGDYLTLEDEGVVIELPADWFHALISASIVEVYDTLKDTEAKQSQLGDMQLKLTGLREATEPRVQGAAKKVIRHHGPLRKARYGRNR